MINEWRHKRENKQCLICGDFYNPSGWNQKYCSKLCAKIAERKRRGSRAGEGAECKNCGKLFIRRGAQKHCSEQCCRAYWKKWDKRRYDNPLGNTIQCFVCGNDIIRESVNQRTCREKCTPSESFCVACSHCGEVKEYSEFYDLRGKRYPAGFRLKCKACHSKTVNERKKEK